MIFRIYTENVQKMGKRGLCWSLIEKMVNFWRVHFRTVFRLSGGSVFGRPLHHFCGTGGTREGSPNAIHHLTCSIGGQEKNHFIEWLLFSHRARLIWLCAIGCGGGMINGSQEAKLCGGK